jgi:hypothetical protein
MLIIKSLSKQLSELNDIVNFIQIESDLTIAHPHYESLKFSDDLTAQLKSLPTSIVEKYLKTQLQIFLQNIYYKQNLKKGEKWLLESQSFETLKNNNTSELYNPFFYKLHDNNCGESYFDSGWVVIKKLNENLFLVCKDDLILEIDRDLHLYPLESAIEVGDTLAIKMPCNLVEGEFYIAVGNTGLAYLEENCQTVNVYFNVNTEGAVALTNCLTQQLNDLKIPFILKVLYEPEQYGRYDTAILNFKREQYINIRQVLESVYSENKSYFRQPIPLLTKFLAPGLSVAEVPRDALRQGFRQRETFQDSFIVSRCRIIADALLEAWKTKKESPDERKNLLHQHFFETGIDLNYPYLESHSEDIYTLLYD